MVNVGELETNTCWNLEAAVELCRQIEQIAPDYGAHVALTGGTLYKDGMRKDVDIIFYCIRQVDEIDCAGLLAALEYDLGLTIGPQFGWVQKARLPDGREIDLFFPEAYPASSSNTGTNYT